MVALSGGVLVGVDFAPAFVARDDAGASVTAVSPMDSAAAFALVDSAAEVGLAAVVVFAVDDRPVPAPAAAFFRVAVPEFRSPMAAPRQV
ncbi:hypothetical protein AB0I28_25805 [Phytomonospora sp. NPDC050363]|uniref:hypothetical protein n=1 Tax=Phytomonospora sp. NPDC050363 TaxID=3155642 RepID=UPI00340D8AC9